ncbi:hypothetical protein N0A02_19190 [Paraburkholderia acidicola]|uniref:Uncharacterized protein n=1 Tax=Paraburkholderia acidicola TaxID=1912599 RepID=A0ABV1LQK1_9BURK
MPHHDPHNPPPSKIHPMIAHRPEPTDPPMPDEPYDPDTEPGPAPELPEPGTLPIGDPPPQPNQTPQAGYA